MLAPMRRTPLLAVGLLVVACGGSGNATTPPTQVPVTDAPATPTAAPDPTAAPTPTTGPTAAPTGGVVIDGYFRDPEGSYELRVDPAWTYQAGAFAQGVEIWFLGPAEDGFTPNMNLLTQTTGGMSLSDYLDVSVQNAPGFIPDFELVASEEFEGDGGTLGLLEYTGTATSGHELHFLAIISTEGNDAVVATLTAPADSFEDWRDEVEPFMLSLRRP
jgi:hypothetical protein